MTFLVAAAVVLVCSGLVAALCGRMAYAATFFGVIGAVTGCVLGLIPAVATLIDGTTEDWNLPWDVPYGSLSVTLDPLSALFLVPMLFVSGLAAIYGSQYLLAFRDRKLLGPPWFFFNLLIASMIVVALASNGVLFLVAWEVMSLASYFLLTFDDEQEIVREGGRVYLIAAHLGAAFLLAFFVLLGRQADSLDFRAIAGTIAPDEANLLFLLALVGFGAKVGFMPLHVWLPEAYPSAPGHVPAVSSGVMVKLGIYGILRTLTLLPAAPPWWGTALIAVGIVSALGGILFALAQQDLTRALAYSTVENVGLIALGLGCGLLSLSYGNLALSILCLAGALFHVVNHALFKALLFFGAAAVQTACGTRQIDRLGGLMKRMPVVSTAFLVGVGAITAMPPLNGFVGEFLIYLGAFGEEEVFGTAPATAALSVIATLALVGGLAVVTFTKIFGLGFLGEPRTPDAAKAQQPGILLTLPMVILAAACIAIGCGAPLLLPLLSPVLELVTRQPAEAIAPHIAATAASLTSITLSTAILVGILSTLVVIRWALLAGREVGTSGTWDCGYAQPTARMQYTGSSYVQSALDFFHGIVRTRKRVLAPVGLFPASGSFSSENPDVPHELVYRPLFRGIEWCFSKLRWLQHGHVHLYVLYVGLTILALLVWYASVLPES